MQEQSALAPVFATIPIAAIAVLIHYVRQAEPRERIWAVPAGLLLAAQAFMCIRRLVSCWIAPISILVFALSSALAVFLGYAATQGPRFRAWRDSQEWVVARRLQLGMPVALAALTALAIEAPWNNQVIGGFWYGWLETILVGLVLAMLYFLAQRRRGACLIGIAAASFIGIAQFFVRRFKNCAILPTDLLALDTAMAVSGGYTFSIDERLQLGVCVALAAVVALAWCDPVSSKGFARGHRRLANLGLSLLCAAWCAFLVIVPDYSSMGVGIMYWYSTDWYQNQGFLPTFITCLQDLPIKKPKSYSDEEAQAIEKRLAKAYDEGRGSSEERSAAEKQFDEVKPTIIVVMNETFSDLSEFDGMHAGYKGPQYFKSIDDALLSGELYMSVQGGGTCNTEFEFLTGISLAYVGAGKYPYSIYQLDGVQSIATQLEVLGYTTTAIHPNYASNWNRNRVYPQLGFGSFQSIDDFGGMPDFTGEGQIIEATSTGIPWFHSGVSDQGTYDRILEILANDDRPQFIFDVTMQNHGSYNQYNIPDDKLTHYHVEDYEGEETDDRLNEFISCIEESDRALEYFMGKLRELDRPVVLVFFGDHQPSMSPSYNDYWYTDEKDPDHVQRVYHTNYIVWANYDVAGNTQTSENDTASVDALAALTFDAIGVPLTSYQRAQLASRTEVPALNLNGYQDADRIWHDPKDMESDARQTYDDMAWVAYRNFATKV